MPKMALSLEEGAFCNFGAFHRKREARGAPDQPNRSFPRSRARIPRHVRKLKQKQAGVVAEAASDFFAM